jgi:hypothetical protein
MIISVKDRSMFRSIDTERVLDEDDVEAVLTIPRQVPRGQDEEEMK